MKTKTVTEQSGQALVELSFAMVLLYALAFGVIDFSRAIYQVEVIKNLAGEGSSMASRGTSPSKTVQTVATYAGGDLSLSTLGCVIVTAVTNTSGAIQVTAQASQCAFSATSKVGCLKGQGSCGNSNATLPAAASTALLAEPSGSSVYVTEIFYNYNAVTPTPALLGNVLPSQWYNAAYY